MMAAANGNLDMVKLLLQHNADVNTVSKVSILHHTLCNSSTVAILVSWASLLFFLNLFSRVKKRSLVTLRFRPLIQGHLTQHILQHDP